MRIKDQNHDTKLGRVSIVSCINLKYLIYYYRHVEAARIRLYVIVKVLKVNLETRVFLVNKE